MSTNALSTLKLQGLPSTSVGSTDDFNDLAKGSNFLGRLTLFGGSSKACKKNLIPIGHFGIPVSADEVIDLGDSVDILPLARRPKAIDMSDKPVISVYDANDPEFKRIRALAGTKDSGCQFGPSFLVVERKTGRLLEYFLGAATHRPEAQKIYPALQLTEDDIKALAAQDQDVTDLKPHGPQPLTLKSKLVETEKNSWHVPVVLPCSTPFARLPKDEVLLEEATKFLTAKTELESDDKESPKSGRKR